MLEANEITALVNRMWIMHQGEIAKFDRIHDYVAGRLGRPQIPEDSDDEVRDIWRLCVHNVLTLVLDAFTQNLSVVGYRTANSDENSAGWRDWQRNQMDARQAEIYSAAVKYGVAYCVADFMGTSRPVFRPRSPRQLIAVYEDPQVDRWPQFALETWIDSTDAKPRRRGTLIDDQYKYPLDLGPISSPVRDEDNKVHKLAITLGKSGIGDPVPHTAQLNGERVCPVVRYTNRRDCEDLVDGEIERLIDDQRTINEVNFDRLIVARFGAFPQKVITGWTGSKQDLLSATARKTWTFDDDGVRASTLAPASVEPYNTLIGKLEEHVARRAQISPTYIMSGMVNLSADALAAAERNQQRKLMAMRESHGESHEQLLQLSASMTGEVVDDGAEVVWRDTEARSVAAVVDAIYKLADALAKGLPIEPFLPLVPGLTQQMIAGIKRQAPATRVASLVSALRPAAAAAVGDSQVSALTSRTTPAGDTALAG